MSCSYAVNSIHSGFRQCGIVSSTCLLKLPFDSARLIRATAIEQRCCAGKRQRKAVAANICRNKVFSHEYFSGYRRVNYRLNVETAVPRAHFPRVSLEGGLEKLIYLFSDGARSAVIIARDFRRRRWSLVTRSSSNCPSRRRMCPQDRIIIGINIPRSYNIPRLHYVLPAGQPLTGTRAGANLSRESRKRIDPGEKTQRVAYTPHNLYERP